MAVYFEGRKRIGEFSQSVEDGRGRFDWEVFEEWIDIDQGTTARCGMPGTCVVERSVGVSEKTTKTLKSVIGGTFGVKDVWSVKAELEGAIGREINWNEAVKSTKTVEFEAPKCGRYALTIFRLRRWYYLTYFRKRLFSFGGEKWDPKWTRSFPEDTNTHELMPDIEEIDPHCKCQPAKDSPPIDGRLSFDFGSVSFRAPYRLTPQGFDAQIGNKIVAVSVAEPDLLAQGLAHGLTAVMSAELVPEPLLFLADLENVQELEARVHRLPDAAPLDEDRLAPMVGHVEMIESIGFAPSARDEVLKGSAA